MVLVLVPVTATRSSSRLTSPLAVLVRNEALRRVQVLHTGGRQRIHVLVVRLGQAGSRLAQTASIVQRAVRGRVHPQLGRRDLVLLQIASHVSSQRKRSLVFSAMLVGALPMMKAVLPTSLAIGALDLGKLFRCRADHISSVLAAVIRCPTYTVLVSLAGHISLVVGQVCVAAVVVIAACVLSHAAPALSLILTRPVLVATEQSLLLVLFPCFDPLNVLSLLFYYVSPSLVRPSKVVVLARLVHLRQFQVVEEVTSQALLIGGLVQTSVLQLGLNLLLQTVHTSVACRRPVT